jgi:hypothetical protein
LEHTKRSKEKDSNEIETIDQALIIESGIIIRVVFERESSWQATYKKIVHIGVQNIVFCYNFIHTGKILKKD